MPGKNVIKTYIEGGFYHIYNRGVNKNNIFLDEIDYKTFLYSLKIYLLPKEKLINELKEEDLINEILPINNFFNQIELICFCLMPNHFHLLLRQKDRFSLEFFMRSLASKYVRYFNQRHKRVGHLFQGIYKAVLIETEEQLIHTSRYIHLNPKEILKDSFLINYRWSSYSSYVKNYRVEWLKKDYVLSYFNQVKGYGFSSYQGFVEGYKEKSEYQKLGYKKLILDEDH